jgi:hypothetical protein
VWAIQVASPELAALRKSYGLSPLPNGDHQFHITVAVRRKNVLAPNEVAKVDGSRGTAKAAAADLLPGGAADNEPDSKFPPEALAEGKKHEREHTNDGQIAKEVAKDHLSEDPAYYKKVRKIEGEKNSRHAIIRELLEAKDHSDNKRYGHKAQILRKLMEQSPQDWAIDDSAPKYPGVTHTPTNFRFHTDRATIPQGVKSAGSVYLNQALQAFNPAAVTGPTAATPQNKTLLGKIHGQLSSAKQRGDFALQAERNHRMWRAQLDPNYRYQLAIQAFRGQLPTPSLTDQVIERYGDGALASLQPKGQ